jgi:hypothetical protein
MKRNRVRALRGFLNVGMLLLLIAGSLCLFIFHPVVTFLRGNTRNIAISGIIRINTTCRAGACTVRLDFCHHQSPIYHFIRFQMPWLIDPDTPFPARQRPCFNGGSTTSCSLTSSTWMDALSTQETTLSGRPSTFGISPLQAGVVRSRSANHEDGNSIP